MTDLLSRTTQGGLGLEELNRLGDRGIPVFEILAEKLGITRNEISEFGKSDEGARKITEALAEGLDERFGGATADRLGNISTLMSNFSIAVKNAAGQVGEAMKPALSSLILTVTEFIEKNKDLAETIGTVLGSALNGVQFLLQLMADNAKLVGSAVVGLTAALGAKGLASALTAATAGFNLLKNAMKTNPFGLLAIGIATLIAYLSFENGLGRTFVQIKAAVDVLGKAFGRFTSFLADKVGGVVTWLKDRFFDFIQVLIDSYNAIARIIPGLDEVSSSARELGDVVSAGVGDALDYAAGKAGEMKDAIVAAIPPEVLAQYDELKTAVREAGETYDELKEKSKQAGETIAGVTQIPEIKAGGVVIDKKQSKEEVANAKKLENSMKGLTDRLLPLKAAKEKYKQETELLNRALLEGKITTTEFGIAMTNLNKEYQDFLDSNSEGTKTWMDGWREATDEYVKRARDASSNAKELFSTATQGMEDAIVGFVKTGKLSFKSLMSDIAEQILRSQIRQLMGNLFGGGGSGGGSNIFSSIGKLFGGFFANGGFLPAGQVGIVGEKGPELISGPANITPMTGTNVTYNINAVDAPSFQDLVARDPSFIHAVSMQGARSI
jgi:hypothetical protein